MNLQKRAVFGGVCAIPIGGILYEIATGELDAGGSRSSQERLAYQFVELFRMLLLGHHPAIIKDFERGTRVQLK